MSGPCQDPFLLRFGPGLVQISAWAGRKRAGKGVLTRMALPVPRAVPFGPDTFVRREGDGFQRVRIPSGKGLLQPEAIEAVDAATRRLKPSMERVASGDSASRQAVTRVNVEQASKGRMWEPTQQRDGEGRGRRTHRRATQPPAIPPG